MLDRIIKFSINNKLIIGLFAIALIIWGSYSLTQLPIDAVPDITNNQVQVITVAPSLAAQEVERLITFPVEMAMATIPHIETMRSFSRFGLSVITIVFEEDVDVYWARQQINERLAEVQSQIPTGIGTPKIAPLTTGLGEIYQYVVRPKKGYEHIYSPMELRTIQDWIIRRQLLGTPGVADVSSFGGYLKQYEISINPEKLRSMNISITDVFTALERNNQNTGGAYIEKKPNAYFIRSEGFVKNIEDIENIVIKNISNGNPVTIRDVASVKYGYAVRYGAMTRNGEGEVTGAVVMMLKGENSAKVIKNIKKRIIEIQKTLPEGVVIEPFLDRTKLVNKAISTVSKNLIEGALIVIFILVLMLGNIRAGLVVASVIPLSMLFAFGMMNIFGVSGNLMSLGAIDFGLIVDGAVIIVESVVHRIKTRKHHYIGIDKLSCEQMDMEVYAAASKIRSAASFGEIIILIVYLPILTLIGIEGKMFKPMAQTVSFAILGAFILSLTYIPMMSALFLSRKTEYKKNISDKLMNFFQKIYDPLIRFSLNHKITILGIAIGLLLLAFLIFKNMGGEFIPTLEEGDFAVETRLLPGTSLSETIETTLKAQKILLEKFPEIKQVVGKIGTSEIPTDPMPIESGDLMIILKDKDEWTSAITREELANKMKEALSVIPGVTFGFQQPIQMRFNELMTGVKQDVVIKIYGEDLNILSDYAKKIGKLVSSINGAEDVYVEQVIGLPQIQIQFNRDAIAKYGLNVHDINSIIETAFAGKVAGQVYEGERRFDLVVRLDKTFRQDIENVRNLFITTPKGAQIPLYQVADIFIQEGPNQIQRDNAKRRIIVGFNVRNRDVESVVKEIKNKMEKNIHFLPGYYITYGGQFENLINARQRLSIAVPVALLLIFILLFFTFHSVKQSVLILTAVPLSAIGGVFVLYFRGMPFSISAGVGFIALFGVAVLNGIVLIAEFNRLKAEGLTDLKEIVLKGTRIRLRPVLMTASVASLGFLPMALSTSAGAEVQRPLATVVIGGLITATLLTLIVLPILYIYFEQGFKISKRIKTKSSLLIIGILLSTSVSNAQNDSIKPLSLNDIIKIALDNNLKIKSAKLNVEYNKQLSKASIDIPKTQFTWQHGQYNSFVKNDNYFDVSQSFAFPTIYIKNLHLANAITKSSEYQQSIIENEIVAEVKRIYYKLALAQYSVQLWFKLDSIFSDFNKSADLKYKTGESNLLEKITAETQSMEIKNQLNMAIADVEIYKKQLQVLLNTNQHITISNQVPVKKDISISLSNDSNYSHNPVLNFLNQEIIIQQYKKSLANAQLLPEFTIGYFNQSLIGYYTTLDGTQEKYYGPNDRFTGIKVGLAIPLWLRPYNAKIRAADVQIKIVENNYQQYNLSLQKEFQQGIQTYLKYKMALDYYEQKALSQSKIILENTQKSFIKGEIGYVEYVQNIRQSIQIQLNYLNILDNYNQSVIYLEFLSGIN